MLMEFTIGNFLSFSEKQTLSMNAGKFRLNSDRLYKDNNCKILKFMAVYGANASGKSNLIDAFGWFQSFVVSGFKRASYRLYCKVEEKYRSEPSHFSIKVKIDEHFYTYGFDAILNTSSVVKEYLYETLKNGNKKMVFERNVPNGTFTTGSYFTSEELLERIKIYGEDIKNDGSVLFLKIMNQNKASLYEKKSKLSVFKDIYFWIKYKLDINTPESTITNYLLLKDGERLQQIIDKLKYFDFGIETSHMVEITEDKVATNLPKDFLNDVQQELQAQKDETNNTSVQNPAVLIRTYDNIYSVELSENGTLVYRTLEFKHKNSSASFTLSEESDGTVRLLNIIEVLLEADNDKVYIIDEINRTFHPLLTIEFIREFLDLAKTRDTQLIVTTHESQLMDLKLLRKDEISFINKNNYGYSTIDSLDNYDDRFDKKILNEYFLGKYHAIPIFKSE